ncbi:hypothetical protein KUTeg_008455 [Tegillarca granosa]|uniref:Tyr recombinase domain-containing protein n=1 Tax=Tegillarca granosa TaxID=220873 RepID=A0ABQ9F964_TEGGR|nr:hypothetical protein KUTeg_008455 [Tegillarca granosa]
MEVLYDLLTRSHWGTLAHFKDHETFGGIVQMLPQIVKKSKADTTNKKYDDYFKRFRVWCNSHQFSALPCSVSILCSFLGGLIQRGGRRILAKPINKKEPVTIDILNKLIDIFGVDKCNLLNLRICVLCLLGFNELVNMKLSDISFKQGYVEISIRKSKTDIYRRGNVIVISETGNKLCPVSWLRDFINYSRKYLFSEERRK